MQLNEFQTTIDKEFIDSIPKEVYTNIMDHLENVQFIKNLTSPNMLEVKDLPKDENGKIILWEQDENENIIHDYITKPHKLVNMDYFRPAALYYKQHGVYTHLTPNKHPKSPYRLFWLEEKRRCIEGYVREDGEWIPGILYFYWNYCPIMLSREVGKTKKANRVQDFPDPWLGDYLFFHYMLAAREYGMHIAMIKCRGVGSSFKMGVLGPHRTIFFKKQKTFYIAYEKEYLNKDGVLNKAWDYMDFLAQNTPFPRMRLIDSLNRMAMKLGYKDLDDGTEKGTLGEIIGISTKDDPDKPRGKRGTIMFEEFGKYPKVTDTWNICRPSVEDGDFAFDQLYAAGCVCAGTKVWTNEGRLVNIEKLKQEEGIIGYDIRNASSSQEPITWMKPPAKKQCVRITTNMGKVLECSIDHPIYSSNIKNRSGKTIFTWNEAENLKERDYVAIPNSINIFGEENMWNPKLVGLLIGDGSYGYNAGATLTNCDKGVIDYVESNFDTYSIIHHITNDGRPLKTISIRGIRPELRKLGIINQVHKKKSLPINIHKYNKESICKLISGFFDADGYVNIRKNKSRKDSWLIEISASSCSKKLLEEFQHQLIKLGVHSKIRTRLPRLDKKGPIKDVNKWYELTIADINSAVTFAENINLLCEHKQERLNKILNLGRKKKTQHSHKNFRKEKIIKVERIGLQYIYNLTAGKTHTYIANNIITHNTGGSEGSDFQGAEDMMYNPSTYKILGLPNVFDLNSQGGQSIFHWGSYLSRKGCMNIDGMPDVVKALKEVFIEFYKIKQTSVDGKALTQRRAELAVTIKDAIMKVDGTLFPVADIKDIVVNIMSNYQSFVRPHYVGKLIITHNNTVEFVEDLSLTPIRDYPIKDKFSMEGAVEIFEKPVRNSAGKITPYRYISGIDTVDDDHSTTNSLPSIFIMDSFTERIVAEYTGRPQLAKQFYEIARRLLLYYNAICNYENDKKGLYAYFTQQHSLHLLCTNPEILEEKNIAKISANYGNKKYGTNSSKMVNMWGRRLQADWLMRPAYNSSEDESGEIQLNMHKIRSIGYLKELMNWNADGNFDRVSAMGMLMILKEDVSRIGKRQVESKITTIRNDPFWSRHLKKTI